MLDNGAGMNDATQVKPYLWGLSKKDYYFTLFLIIFFIVCFVWIFKDGFNRGQESLTDVLMSVTLGFQILSLSALSLGCFYAYQLSKNTSFYYIAFGWLAHGIYKVFTIGSEKPSPEGHPILLIAIISLVADVPLFLSSFPEKKRKLWLPIVPIATFALIVFLYWTDLLDYDPKRQVIYLISAIQPILIFLWLTYSTIRNKIFGISMKLAKALGIAFFAIAISQTPYIYFQGFLLTEQDDATKLAWRVFSLIIFLFISVIVFVAVKDKLSGIKKTKDSALQQLEIKGDFETLGYLSSSIEHEIRNPLAVFKDEIDDLKSKFQHRVDLTEQFVKLEKSADRIAIAADVINVLRKKKEEFAEDLKECLVVERVNSSLRYVRKEYTDWADKMFPEVTEKTKELWIMADFYYLEQAIINVFKNSYEAIEKNKTGKIFIDLFAGENKERVVLTFRDTGAGFIQEDIPKLTKPEYTQKDKSNSKANRGIGLFVCDKIVHLHNGTINFSNSEEGGAVVTMEFPRHYPKKALKIHTTAQG